MSDDPDSRSAIMSAMSPPDVVQFLHVDDALLVVSKPSGLLSVPGRAEDKQDCMASRVRASCVDAEIVHRLDMSTSGLMVFARGKDVQRQLSEAFAQRQVHKRYRAWVAGRPEPDVGAIELPLMTDWPNRPRQKIDAAEGKQALTRYRTQHHDAASNTSLVELEPVTGRTHQLRVHLQAIGHPILGDALYAPQAIRDLSARLMLHAEWLGFSHPKTGQGLSFHCPAPF